MISCIRFEIRRFWVVWSILLILGAAIACGTPVPILSVSNDFGRTLTEIRKKSCGDIELAFVPIEDSRLGPGETRGVVLPLTHADLVAYDSRGRIVGEQRGLTLRPGARWVLRR